MDSGVDVPGPYRMTSKEVSGDVIQGPSLREINEDSGTFVIQLDDGTGRFTLAVKTFSAKWKGHGKMVFPLSELGGKVQNSSLFTNIRVEDYDPDNSKKGRATLTIFVAVKLAQSGSPRDAM